jgi:FMN phosphatase YigB (HAD superfamily)
MSEKKWIVIDLDGTLCDCSHRVHLAQNKQWEEFHAGIPNDKPYKEAVEFLEAVSEKFNIVICSGREEKHQPQTVDWLFSHMLDAHITAILMRPEGDFSSDHELKLRLLDEFFGSREKALESVLMILDDRDKVVQAFRDAGFRCWQVQAGSY